MISRPLTLIVAWRRPMPIDRAIDRPKLQTHPFANCEGNSFKQISVNAPISENEDYRANDY